ncbi:MAG TPA: cation diffusion facilitator family transporter [Gemmatimonadales bacterium]|nr:cation diffusion facilitator family transporter [Gemmatimonadales bacterium]
MPFPTSTMPSGAKAREKSAGVRRVLGGILVANIVVVIVKFAIGIDTNSLAVFGDALQSSVDSANNLFAIFVVRVAAKAPDEDHPYGHAKFETLGALLIALLLALSIFELVRGAVARLLSGAPPLNVSGIALGLLVVTLLVNIGVVWIETRAGRRLQSDLLLADALHTRTDVFITIGVLAGLALSRAGLAWADPALALIVALLVGRAGYQILRRSIPTLVDERAFDQATIQREAEGVTGVVSAYAIRSRRAGDRRFAELTIAVDGQSNVAKAHGIADQVEDRLRNRLQLDEVTVHVEPC